MNISTKATGLTLSEESRSYLWGKLETLCDKYIDESVSPAHCDAELALETSRHRSGQIFRAEATISAHGKVYRAVGEGDSLHAAIDVLDEKLAHELRKAKEKQTNLLRRSGAKVKDAIRGFRPWPFRKRR